MRVTGTPHAIGALVLAVELAGCALPGWRSDDADAANEQARTLLVIVTDLEVQRFEDPYRDIPLRDAEGRDVFSVALWRLDRMRGTRVGQSPANVDLVLEFARARALERLRRYEEALAAYASVSETGSILTEEAESAAAILRRFVALGTPLPEESGDPGASLEPLELRIDAWTELARELAGTPYAALALVEAETWEGARVRLVAQRDGPRAAITACQRMIERNRDSKLYARHLIRLGDLYADAARSGFEDVQPRAIGPREFERLLERAFAAYELAEEERDPAVRREAETRIEALLAYHEGVRLRAP